MVALILARGGSKRVPGKNIKPLDGTPLIGHVILAAKKSKLITDGVYVSTDDSEIKAVAESFGANVIDRPSELSKDDSTDLEAFKHFIEHTGWTGAIVHLRATTPLINPDKLDEGIQFFIDNYDDCTSMRSAHEAAISAHKLFEKDDKYFIPLFEDRVDRGQLPLEYYNLPNQSLPKTYKPNGYIDIVKTDCIDSGSMHGLKILSFITDFAHDIDTQEDFDYIEYIINKKKNE